MKKVLHILEAVEGGAWRHVQDLIRSIHGRGYEFSVVLSLERDCGNSDEVRSFLASKNVSLYEIPMKRSAAPGDMATVLQLTKLLRRLKPDLLHAHCAKAGILGRVAAKLSGVPSVYTPHCFPFLMQSDRLARIYEMIERGVVSITSAIIVISREEQEAARKLGYPEERIHFIPNGIEPSGVELPEYCDNQPLKLGFFGRAGAQKGGDTFLRLVEALNKRGICTEGVMYGYSDSERRTSSYAKAPADKSNVGQLTSNMERRTSNIEHSTSNIERLTSNSESLISNLSNKESDVQKSFIRICGSCSQDQVIETMRGLDVIVMPSRWEGLPYVLLEALDAGVPISAYKVGGIADVVVHGVSAMLAEANDFHALVENTARLQESGLRRDLAEGGRVALQKFELSQMIAQTEALYASF